MAMVIVYAVEIDGKTKVGDSVRFTTGGNVDRRSGKLAPAKTKIGRVESIFTSSGRRLATLTDVQVIDPTTGKAIAPRVERSAVSALVKALGVTPEVAASMLDTYKAQASTTPAPTARRTR